MNDPHVEWLRYRLELGPSLHFIDPRTREAETEHFTLMLDAGKLTVRMKEHHASVESAKARLQPFLRAWELDNALKYGSGAFRFVYEDSGMIDRNPPAPGSLHVVLAADAVAIGISESAAILSVGRRDHPPPPENFSISPTVETLWYQYEGYREDKVPLPHMAYFCLTELEGGIGGSCGRMGRANAAAKLGIDVDVLNCLGTLVSEKGDERTARKRPKGGWQPYDPKELTWIEAVIVAAIRRAGEYAAGATSPSVLTWGDFPPLPQQNGPERSSG